MMICMSHIDYKCIYIHVLTMNAKLVEENNPKTKIKDITTRGGSSATPSTEN